MGIGPVPAVRKLLERAGVEVGDLDLVELNEAFASQSLAVIRELGLDPERVNVNGGAIALGHPLGMSGARLVVTLLHELRRRGGRYGLATLCVGVGQGQAALFERTASAWTSSRYLELGLRLGRHVDGLVDAYYGPPEIAERVEAEEPRDPRAWCDAAALLDALDGDASARPAAGCAPSSSGSRPLRAGSPARRSRSRTRSSAATACGRSAAEDVFEAAHRALDELPGSGPLAERYQAWREADGLRGEQLPGCAGLVDDLRSRAEARRPSGGRGVVFEYVSDEPWAAFNYYQGGLRSRIAVNTDVAMRPRAVELVAHETYPGHHTEPPGRSSASSASGLPRGDALMIGAPQALIAEGIAEVGPEVLLGDDAQAIAAEHLAETGVEYDAELARAVQEAGARSASRRQRLAPPPTRNGAIR